MAQPCATRRSSTVPPTRHFLRRLPRRPPPAPGARGGLQALVDSATDQAMARRLRRSFKASAPELFAALAGGGGKRGGLGGGLGGGWGTLVQTMGPQTPLQSIDPCSPEQSPATQLEPLLPLQMCKATLHRLTCLFSIVRGMAGSEAHAGSDV